MDFPQNTNPPPNLRLDTRHGLCRGKVVELFTDCWEPGHETLRIRWHLLSAPGREWFFCADGWLPHERYNTRCVKFEGWSATTHGMVFQEAMEGVPKDPRILLGEEADLLVVRYHTVHAGTSIAKYAWPPGSRVEKLPNGEYRVMEITRWTT